MTQQEFLAYYEGSKKQKAKGKRMERKAVEKARRSWNKWAPPPFISES